MIKSSEQLGAFLRSEATRVGIPLRFDTHYDAQNWLLSWWVGQTFHRLDFQPMPSGEVVVTLYHDHFKFLARFLRWAHSGIPMFPYFAKIKWRTLATLRFPIEEAQLSAVVAQGRGAQQGVQALDVTSS